MWSMTLLWAFGACQQPNDTSSTPSTTPGTQDTEGATVDSGQEPEPEDSGEPPPPPLRQPAVILFVGDGMGAEHVLGGSLYAHGEAGQLFMESAPSQASVVTASYTGYTDSAASASAYATGHKTWNGVLGLDAELNGVQNILEAVRAAGLATGVVSTDALTGATPSAFVVHHGSRNDTSHIASEWAKSPPDLLLGGGAMWMQKAFDDAGLPTVTTQSELDATDPTALPLYGLFADTTFPYVAEGYEKDQPTLTEMVDAAIDRLSADPEGFVLIVESARIDHASHQNNTNNVHVETVAFDEAIEAAVNRVSAWTERDVHVLVTADHECGGMHVEEGTPAGKAPETTWRWRDHTNADVPLYGWGEHVAAVAGQRIDNTAIHAILEAAALTDELTLPAPLMLPDGRLDDLGSPVVTQTQTTDFGEGYNQLDGLRLTADTWGLKIGIDGVFKDGGDAVIVWLDLDYGMSTGVGSDLTLADVDGNLDLLLGAPTINTPISGLGFDLAVGQIEGSYLRFGDLQEYAGARHFTALGALVDDLSWQDAIINFDSGNMSGQQAAVDAAATGLTENGLEAWVPWYALFAEGTLPSAGTHIAVYAHCLNSTGSRLSNQALPPLADGVIPDIDDVSVTQVAVIEVDGQGMPTKDPYLTP